MGMDFRGQVWKRVWKMAWFGLKLGQDLGNRAAHPYQLEGRTVIFLRVYNKEKNFVQIFWSREHRPKRKLPKPIFKNLIGPSENVVF